MRVNDTLCGWLGYAARELEGSTRFHQLLTVGCKIFHHTHWMPLLQMQGSVAEVQLDFAHRGGAELPMLVNAAVQGEGPNATHYISVILAKDRRSYERELLQARRRAEEALERERRIQDELQLVEARLRLALDAASLRVWHLDLSSGQMAYSAGAGSLIGRPELDDVPQDLFHSCIHPEDREAEEQARKAALDPRRREAYAVEYRLISSERPLRIVSSTGRATFHDDGRVTRFAGVLRDVTETREAERLLRERAVLGEQLVGIVSHDLRTPLNTISVGVHLLGMSGMSASQVRTIERIGAAGRRATRLTEDLLDFTQAQLGGGLRVVPREIDVHATVAECVDELRIVWPGRMIQHVRRGDGETKCDPDRLVQLVTNLANNALTYGTADAAVQIRSQVDQGGLELSVHNGGAPIPPEILPHIFEPMRRGEQQVKLGSRSVGLGLYIVKQICHAHGGRISVESTAQTGTTFTASFPRH